MPDLISECKQEEEQTVYLKNYQPPLFLVESIHLDVDLQDDVTTVISTMHLQQRSTSETGTLCDLVLNGEELNLISIKLNGELLNRERYELEDNLLTIYALEASAILEITVHIFPEKNTALSGLYRSANTYCTQCEAQGFRRITYFLDRPDVLSRYTTTIRAECKRYPYLLSNGNLIAKGSLENGRHFATWEDPFKKPCYLFALVAGDFDLLFDQFKTQSGRLVDLRIYVEKGLVDQAQHALHCLKAAMRWDEEAFGREYDLDIYMIVAIGDFNMGAMENKGLNIFNIKYVLAKPETATDNDYIHILSVIGHEYFHNWSGNRVTCRDWFQLSLKEGLTIFRDQNFSADQLSQAVMRIRDVNDLREAQFPEDAGPLAHPVRPDAYIEINNFYTATVYNKGAEVLRMLQTLLGKALFRQGMDLYFNRYDGDAVTIEDYVSVMEEVSKLDLSQFKLWYSQAGTPVVTVEDDYDAPSQKYTLTIHQSCPPTPQQAHKAALHIPIRMGLIDDAGRALPLHLEAQTISTEKVLSLTQTWQQFEFYHVPSRPIPSLLRNFSAPVKLIYAYADQELQFLFKHDSDAFNRYEAGQQYMLRVLTRGIEKLEHEQFFEEPLELIDLWAHALGEKNSDLLLLAEMLQLPSEKYVGEQFSIIPIDAIHQAREELLTAIAKHLESILLLTYQEHHQDSSSYQFNMQAVGKRQLKNRCLAYLARLPQHFALAKQQFDAALGTNMTDTEAALIALSRNDCQEREQALAAFYERWKQDALVVDKWLAIQAAAPLPFALKQVKKLMRHPAFDIKNPNKVYALIGSFSQRNLTEFHSKTGEGYAFLREVVESLNALNPQIAARMVKPLTAWRRYDKDRQLLMRGQLEALLENKKLSKDVYELVIKSL